MSKLNKTLIAIGSVLLIFTGTIESNLFIKRTSIEWDPAHPIRDTDFSGYPNFLSTYAAAISSYFNYEITGNSYDSVRVKTLMQTHHSWMKKSFRNSDYLLRHEQYHFNMSEVYARKFKKLIYSLRDESFSEEKLKSLYLSQLRELNAMQDRYDTDCDHSLLMERQKDWEYLIDSMLNSFAYYAEPLSRFTTASVNSHFYRGINIDGRKQITGRHPIDSSLVKDFPAYYAFYYQEDGQLNRTEYNENREPAVDAYYGVAEIRFYYTDGVEWRYFYGTNGKKIKNIQGVYGQKLVREEKELIVYNIDSQGELMQNVDGICRSEWQLDIHGRRISGILFNREGDRVVDRNGYQIITYKYDHKGNIVEAGNYNDEFQLMNNAYGYAYTRYIFDEMDHVVETYFFSSDHKPVINENGISGWKANYDVDGNIIQDYHRGFDGKISTDEQGRVLAYFSYDSYDRVVEEKYFGPNKNLIIDDLGHGRLQRDYDSLSRVVELRNFGAYDQYLNDIEDVCKTVYRYNDKELVTEMLCYTADSGIIHHLKTVAYSYDKSNRPIEQRYFDEEGNPMADSTGIHCLHDSHDTDPTTIETTLYDVQDSLMETHMGISRELNTFNDQGQRTIVQYFDLLRRPTTGDKGVEEIRWGYNDDGQAIREAYYDENGKLTENNEGVAIKKMNVDQHGILRSINYFDPEENLVISGTQGFAIIEYDYTAYGDISRVSFRDKQGRYTTCTDGYAIENLYYDLNRHLIRGEYLSKFKQPVQSSDGYASRELQYDGNGNVVALVLRDETGQLIEDHDGYAIYNYLYNRNGMLLSTFGYGADENNLEEIDMGDFSIHLNIHNTQAFIRHATNNISTGVRTSYYNNGQKQSEGMYIDGKLQGTYRSWYENGILCSEVEYVDGKRNGLSLDYYKNGAKWREVYYENNNMIRNTDISWYMNGQLQSKNIDGEEVYWDENGKRIL
ncbi:MAG: hypothetical protein ABFS10_13795 [Bacteroidota bacterium]